MIYFIRHGESEANQKGVFAGQKDDSILTENGRKQAAETITQLHTLNVSIDRVVSSSLKRAVETAQIITKGLGLDESNIIVDNRITEYDMGSLTGTPLHHISSKELVSATNAEDPKAFRDRSVEGVRTYQHMPGNTLIVSHAGVGRALESVKAGIEPGLFYDIPAYKNASVTMIDWIH